METCFAVVGVGGGELRLRGADLLSKVRETRVGGAWDLVP